MSVTHHSSYNHLPKSTRKTFLIDTQCINDGQPTQPVIASLPFISPKSVAYHRSFSQFFSDEGLQLHQDNHSFKQSQPILIKKGPATVREFLQWHKILKRKFESLKTHCRSASHQINLNCIKIYEQLCRKCEKIERQLQIMETDQLLRQNYDWKITNQLFQQFGDMCIKHPSQDRSLQITAINDLKNKMYNGNQQLNAMRFQRRWMEVEMAQARFNHPSLNCHNNPLAFKQRIIHMQINSLRITTQVRYQNILSHTSQQLSMLETVSTKLLMKRVKINKKKQTLSNLTKDLNQLQIECHDSQDIIKSNRFYITTGKTIVKQLERITHKINLLQIQKQKDLSLLNNFNNQYQSLQTHSQNINNQVSNLTEKSDNKEIYLLQAEIIQNQEMLRVINQFNDNLQQLLSLPEQIKRLTKQTQQQQQIIHQKQLRIERQLEMIKTKEYYIWEMSKPYPQYIDSLPHNTLASKVSTNSDHGAGARSFIKAVSNRKRIFRRAIGCVCMGLMALAYICIICYLLFWKILKK